MAHNSYSFFPETGLFGKTEYCVVVTADGCGALICGWDGRGEIRVLRVPTCPPWAE